MFARRIMIAQKRRVQVTLSLEVYDDLDIESMDWNELLKLEGDESVHVKIKDYDEFY